MYAEELQWIHKLQEWMRSPWMDQFFICWNYVDSHAFVFVLIATIWYLVSRRVGIKMAYILILSAVVSKVLKGFFDLPRPCQLDPSVGVLCFSTPGFPSGAAQTAVLYAGIAFIECKNQLFRWSALIFALMLCFSRVYLGVHFFTDILGGLAVGAGLLLIYWKLFPLAEKKWKVAIFAFPLLLLAIGQLGALYLACHSLGIGCGLLLGEKQQKILWIGLAQLIVVFLGVWFGEMGTTLYPSLKFLLGFATGFWISYLGAVLVRKSTKNF
ncbi:MAG: phosphatase PAP2 family protein [Chlamydiales bacterium]|nr:phosphatase PAP2 family protein [Chlamydiales bacterium]